MNESSAHCLTSWPADDAIAAVITDVLDKDEAPGAIVRLSAPGLAPWTGAFGLANVDAGTPMQPAMHGRIGSITKPMVATLVLQLVDEGKLSLDEPLATALPAAASLPNAASITVRNLLTMRSGLFNFTEAPGIFDTISTNPDRIWTPAELIAVAAERPANFAPGAQFEYSNTNYILLGEIVALITGKPVEQVFRERLTEPFGLSETSWPAGPELPEPFADGYERVPLDGPRTDAPPTGPTTVERATRVAASAGGAAGAVVSTVADLDRWIDILFEGKALEQATSRAQLEILPILQPDGTPSGMGYGMGVADFGGIVGHNGGIPGFQSFAARIVALGVNVSVIVNIDYGVAGTHPADAMTLALRTLLAGHAAATSR